MSTLDDFAHWTKEKLYGVAHQIAESDDYSLYRNIHKAADDNNCIPVTPAEDELQLDLDSEEAWEYFQARLVNLKQDLIAIEDQNNGLGAALAMPLPTYEWWPSKSGLPKRHVIVKLPGKVFDNYERLAWQYVLGDDPVRGAMNFRRVLLGIPDPFVLFKPKEKTDVIP